MLLSLLQSIIDGFGAVLSGLISLLPGSPFAGIYSLTLGDDLLSFLMWIIPMPQILAMLEAWGVAIGIFYLHMSVLRWVKAIE